MSSGASEGERVGGVSAAASSAGRPMPPRTPYGVSGVVVEEERAEEDRVVVVVVDGAEVLGAEEEGPQVIEGVDDRVVDEGRAVVVVVAAAFVRSSSSKGEPTASEERASEFVNVQLGLKVRLKSQSTHLIRSLPSLSSLFIFS